MPTRALSFLIGLLLSSLILSCSPNKQPQVTSATPAATTQAVTLQASAEQLAELLAQAPSLTTLDVTSIEGLPVSFSPKEKGVLLVYFWNTTSMENWTETIQDAIVLYRRFHDKGLDVISVFTDERDERELFNQTKDWPISWPLVMNQTEQGKLTDLMKIPSIPAERLYDSSKKPIAVQVRGEEGHALIAKALNLNLAEIPMPESPVARPLAQSGFGGYGGMGIIPAEESSPGAGSFFGSHEERQAAEPCKENLRKIGFAITDYQQDHKGELPMTLFDLYPNYIKDATSFICPLNPNGIRNMHTEKNLKCSYDFEFGEIPASSGGGPGNKNYREWKTEQLKDFGDHVPVVRCQFHPRSINLTYGGEVNFYLPRWEQEAPRGTLDDLECKIRAGLRLVASAVDKYKRDKGEVPNELIDLIPDYLKENAIEPDIFNSFSYQFTPNKSRSQGYTYRQWKMSQREEFGDYVPLVRARAVTATGKTINLAYNGEIWESQSVWENDLQSSTGGRSPSSLAGARVQSDMRVLKNTLESFFIDNNNFPQTGPGNTIDAAAIKIGEGNTVRYIRLTTPVSYIARIPPDPFNKDGKSYRYASDGKAYILASDGPDLKADFDASQYKFDQPDSIKAFLYDPSNGVNSGGDIIVTGP